MAPETMKLVLAPAAKEPTRGFAYIHTDTTAPGYNTSEGPRIRRQEQGPVWRGRPQRSQRRWP